MITCTRRIEFDSAHRVMEHESKCQFIHGHRYVVEATFTAEDLDKQGRVIDFGQVKALLGGWVDDNWDHTAILHEADRKLGAMLAESTGQAVYYLPYNPTAENIARYLLEEICPKLFARSNVRCVRIRVHETPNCYADAVMA